MFFLLRSFSFVLVLMGALLFPRGEAFAHCDGLDGPVVIAAQQALESGDVNLVLLWVQEADELAVVEAFQKSLIVRKLGAEAKDLADLSFFETLVRIHRAGEGAPYTGLKPSGRDLGLALPVADKALETGNPEELLKVLEKALHEGFESRFHHALHARNYEKNNVKSGREFVGAYVEFIHYVERLYQAAATSAHGHAGEEASLGHNEE